MKQNLVTLLIIFVSTMAIRAQNIPEIRIDESSGRIDAVFNLESHTGGFDGCSEIGPFAGVIVDSGSNGPTFQKWIQIKSAKPVQTRAGKSDALEYSLPFPSVSEIIEQSLFSRGTRVTVWGWTCGSGGFLSLRDVIRTGTGTVNGQFKKPKFSESILLGDPYLAAKKAAALNNEIAELVRSASAKFDREIAPGISAGEKGEFETTEEAEARIQKIARLRKANFPKLEGKIMLTALPKIKEYLVTTNSFYRSPVKGSLGTYNADNENFPFIVNGKEVCLFRVPRKIAQTLKQNFVEALTYVDYRLNLDSGQVQLSPERIKIVFRDQEFYSEYVVDGTELQWQIQNQQY